MAILSNLATDALVTASCHIDYRFLSRDPKEAAEIAQKIALASQLAAVDPYRAATHNKGNFSMASMLSSWQLGMIGGRLKQVAIPMLVDLDKLKDYLIG